jgi:hypothetical protein
MTSPSSFLNVCRFHAAESPALLCKRTFLPARAGAGWLLGVGFACPARPQSSLCPSCPWTCFLCRWRASRAKRGGRGGRTPSRRTLKLRSACIAPSQPARERGTRVIRSPRSNSGTLRCSLWPRPGHPRREASGPGGGRVDLTAFRDRSSAASTATQTPRQFLCSKTSFWSRYFQCRKRGGRSKAPGFR